MVMKRARRSIAVTLGLVISMLGILSACVPAPAGTAATTAALASPDQASTQLPSPTAVSIPSITPSMVPTPEAAVADLQLLSELEVGSANTASGRQKLVSDIAWAPDSAKLAVATFADTIGQIELLDPMSLQHLWTVETMLTFDIEFSPDGSALAANFPTPGVILTWDVASGDPLLEARSNQCLVGRYLEFQSGGDRIVTGYDSGKEAYETTIDSWDLQSGQCQGELLHADGLLVSLSVDPTGRYLILTLLKVQEEPSKRVSVWSLETLEPICSVPGTIGALAHSGSALAVVDPEGQRIKVWSVPDCQLLWAIDVDFDVFSLALSPDSGFLAAGGGRMEVWDLSSSSKVADIEEVPSPVTVLAFSPDGRNLISTGSANPGERTRILLWGLGP